jgi:hypothetical protein
MTEKKINAPEYTALVKKMEAARAEVKEAGKRAVKALFAAFFEGHPDVTAIGWTQYTPHFNDGEACEFSLYEFYISTATGVKWKDVAHLYSDGEEGKPPIFTDEYDTKDKKLKAARALVERSADEDIFEAAFGDHVMVIATPKGFHVSEYSHD